MRVFSPDYLRKIGIRIFTGCGAPAEEAAIVADELVEASLMGLESHGVTRYVFYTDEVLNGRIKPGAPVRVTKETGNTAIVDCGSNFGLVGAMRMVEIVAKKAQQAGVACAVSQHCHHVGRLGATVQKLAERGLFSFATTNSCKAGHFVVPWGGREGRLATNPLAYGVPTSTRPVVLDASTSMIAEGAIRVLMHQGKPVPPGRIQDSDGNPTSDPHAFYGPPHGTILPFGSDLGYKGFGLGLLAEILGAVLVGENISDDYRYLNGLFLLAIDPDSFCGRQRFTQLMDELCAYITTTPPAPGHQEVVMPGELDFRTREKRLVEGIPLPDETWQLIVDSAKRVGVTINEQD